MAAADLLSFAQYIYDRRDHLVITPVAEQNFREATSQNERMLRVARRSAAAMPSRPLEQRRTCVYCAPRSS